MLGQEGHTLSDRTKAQVTGCRVVKITPQNTASGQSSTPSSGAWLCRHPQHPHLCFWGWSSRTSQQQQPPSQPASRKSSGQVATGQRRNGTEPQLSVRSWLSACKENCESWAMHLTPAVFPPPAQSTASPSLELVIMAGQPNVPEDDPFVIGGGWGADGGQT